MIRFRSFRGLLGGVLSMALAIGQVAVARGDTAQDKALAAQLFKDGKTLMNAGNYKDACPKFDASARLDPTADGAVLNVALCAEGLGQWSKAWAFFNESIVRAKKAVPPRPEREKLAKEHMAAIEPKLSRVTIKVAADARVAGLVIQWDGTPLDEAAWNTPFPVDPGSHHLAVSAPGHSTWSTDVEIGTVAGNKSIPVPKLEHANVSEPPKPQPVDQTKVVETPTASPTAVDRTSAWIALGAGGVFVLGAVGSFFLTKSAQSDRQAFCDAQQTTTCPDDDSKSRIHRWGTLTYVSAGLGAVGIAVGVVLLTRSPSQGATVQVGAGSVGNGGAGFQIAGAF